MTSTRTTSVRLRDIAVAATGVIVLAACGSQPAGHDMGTMPQSSSSTSASPVGTGSPATGAHNDADVQFATQMIPHHRQAVTMSELQLAKGGLDADVAALATQIEAAQTPEIATMSGWLAGWGANPDPTMGTMSGMDMGMMSQADLDALKAADAATGTEIFLNGMIKHHQGAVSMAQTELESGENTDAKALAQSIVTTQQAEITQMKKLSAG